MNILFKTLIFLIFLVFTNLNATQKQTNNLAQISATSLYNIDKRSLQTNIKVYLKNNPNLKALKIVETLSNESYISFYTNDKKSVYGEELPNNLSHLKKYTSNSIYENEVVGSVTAYYSKVVLKNLDEKEVQWVKNNPLIKIAVVKSWMPFDITDKNGSHHGFHQDIVSLINQKLSLNAKLVIFNTWKEAYAAATKGSVHSIFGLSWTKDREEKYFDYSTAYHYSPYNLIVKRNNKEITSLASVKDKKIGVEEDTVFVKIIKKKAPKANIVFTSNIKDSYENLDKDNIDTFISASLDTILMKKYKFKVAAELYDKSSELFIGSNKKYQTVSSILQKGLNNINLKELNNLRKKWFVKYMNNPVLDSSLNADRLSFNLTKDEEKWSENNSIIKLAVMNYWIKDDLGNSIHTDIIGLLNKYSNLHFIPIRYDTWKDGFNDATNGSIVHGIMNLSWTKERQDNNFHYSKAYHFMPSQLIVRKDNITIKKIEDLVNKSIYVREKAITSKTIKEKVPTAKIINIQTNEDMYAKLSQTNGADAILDYSLDKKLFEKYNLKVVQNVYDKYSEVAIGVSHKQKELMTIINKIYKKIPKEEFLKLQNKDYSKNQTNSSLIKLSKAQKIWISNNPKLKVIEFFDEPPFTLNKAQKEGYIYELLESIIHSTGLEIEYVKGFTSYGSMLESLEKGEVDILSTFPTTLDMGKDSNIVKSTSVLKTPFVLVGQSNDNEIESVEDLFGKKVAVVKGYVQDIYLQKFPQIKRVYVNNNDEGFAAIREGRSKYYINNRANTEYILTKSFSNDLSIIHELSYEHFPPFSLSFAMNGSKKELVEILKIALDSISINTIKTIKDKWIINRKKEEKKIHYTKEEKQWLKEHKTIRVHNEKEWAPYNFYDRSRPRGLSIDFINAVSKKVGLEVEFVTGPTWNDFINKIKNKEIDVMLNIVQSKERDEFLNFTNSYAELLQSVYIREGEPLITSTKDLFGKTFAVPKGFYFEEKLKKFPKIKLLRLEDTLACLQAVSFGKADAMLDLTSVINYYKNKHSITNVIQGGTLGWETGALPLRFGIRKDWTPLEGILNKGLLALSNKQIDTMENKWLFNHGEKRGNMIPLSLEEKRWIKSNEVIVGVEQWAPVIYSQTGKDISGITGDILKLVSDMTGLKFKVENELWDKLLNDFKDNKIDLLPATYLTKERSKYGFYSKPYYKMLDYIYVKDDNSTIRNMKDLEGKRVAIPKGFGTIPKIKEKYPKIEIVETKNLDDSIQKVLMGEVDALFDGQIAVEFNMQDNLISGLRGIPQKSFEAAGLHFFSNKEKTILNGILEKTLENIPVYEINKIKSKWLLQSNQGKMAIEDDLNIKEKKLQDILPVKEILIGLFIFLIVFYFIWKYQIKSTNKDFALRGTLFIIIGLFLFFASAITLLTLQNIEKSQKGDIKESIKSVLNGTYKTIDIWIEAKFKRIQIVLDDGRIIPKIQNRDSNFKELKEHFDTYSKVFEDANYHLFSDNLEIILSSHKSHKLLQSEMDGIFKLKDKNLQNRLVVFPLKNDKETQEHILFIQKIKSKNKTILGYIVMMVDPKKEFSRIMNNGRIGKSGETYAFNKKNQLVSQSRFANELKKLGLLKEKENSLLNIEVIKVNKTPTYPALQAAKKKSGITTEPYLDYRNKLVYGGWIFDDNLGITFVTEIDENEAMGAFVNMKKTIIIIVFSIVMFTIFLTGLVAWISTNSKKSLQKANNDLNKLLASFDENVIASRSDLKGNITYASKAFIEISGYSLEELIGEPHSKVRHPDTPKEVFKDLWKTIQSGKIWKGEIKNLTKSGTVYWVNAVITPELEEDGNVKSYSAIREDITSRKAVEELSANLEIKVEERTKELSFEKQKLQALFDNIPVPMTMFDNEKGTITFVNQRCKDFLGYELEDINTFEKWFNNVQPDPEYQKYAIALWTQKVQEAEAENRAIEPFELNLVSKDGETKVSEIHSFHLEDGSGISFLIDLTQRKATQEEIERSRLFLNTLLDSQEQIIITTNGEALISANESFNKFYTIDGVDSFIENIGRCICDTFDINAPEGYLQIMMDDEKWVDYIISNPNKVHKAIIQKDGINHTFSVTAAKLPGDEDLRSAVFTDITSLENVLEKVERISKHTQDSIEYASLIQHALIPSNDLFDDYFDEHLTIWQPKDIVGGDVYLFEELRDKDECLLMVIDCTGHGVPGAFVTMLVKAIERQVIAKIQNDSNIDVSPAWILAYLNKTMKKLLKQEDDEAISNAGLDAGVIYYNKTDNLIKYAGAEISLFYIEDGEMNTIKGDRHSIGYKKSNASFVFKDHYIDITSKMQFYITTDGYLDQNGGEKAFPLGKRKFGNILLENYQESFVDQKEILLDNLQDYQKKEDRNDDISLVGFSVKPENNKNIIKATKIIEHNWEI